MSAHDVIDWAAILLDSALVAWVASYWVFAPLLGRLSAARFNRESAVLAEAEQALWAGYKATGEWPKPAQAPVSTRRRIAAGVRAPLHRLKTRKDQTGADK